MNEDKGVAEPIVTPMADTLTPKQRAFVDLYTSGLAQTAAARAAGLKHPSVTACQLLALPKVQAAIAEARAMTATRAQISRDEVLHGFLDAVRASATATELVLSWREIGKMLGYYEAEKIEKHITVVAQRKLEDLRMLSDADLAELLDIDLKPKPRVIDVESRREAG